MSLGKKTEGVTCKLKTIHDKPLKAMIFKKMAEVEGLKFNQK